MTSVEYDLTYLREGLAVLKDYLLSGDCTDGASQPTHRIASFPNDLEDWCDASGLAGRSLGGREAAEFSADENLEACAINATAWNIAAHDLRARLNQWRNF
jgi:hypothetical protein